MFNFVYKDIDFAHKLDYASSPKDEYDKHMHVFYEMIYFVKGDVDYHIESEIRHLKTGDVVLMNPGKFHFASVNRDISYERYVLKFPVAFVPEALQQRLAKGYPFFSNSRFSDNIFHELDNLYETYNDEDMYLLCKCKVLEMMVYLANIRQGTPEVKQDDILSVLIDYIQRHLKEDLTLESIAHDLNYSESYLSNSFKKTMKCSLMKYIRSKKIILAHTMIQEGKKAREVSEELGFNDYSTFYRSYLKTIGISPTESRENNTIAIKKLEMQ